MLTRQEIASFLRNKLSFCNWEEILNKSKIQFLKTLTRKHVTSIYFHNIENAATPVENRELPSPKSIRISMQEGQGGTCYQLNYFLKLILLDGLGFKTYMIAAIGPLPGNHMAIVVKLLDPNSYLLDVGSANPLSRPVPLHALPFSGKCGGFSYEFRQLAENEIARYQIGGGLFLGEYTGAFKEKLRLKFELTPREFEYFLSPMEIVFKNMKRSAVCKNLYLFRHFYSKEGRPDMPVNEAADVEPGTKFQEELDFIWIFGYNVLIGGEETRNLYKYSNYKEMLPIVKQYFPNLKDHTLKIAIQALEIIEQYPPNF